MHLRLIHNNHIDQQETGLLVQLLAKGYTESSPVICQQQGHLRERLQTLFHLYGWQRLRYTVPLGDIQQNKEG